MSEETFVLNPPETRATPQGVNLVLKATKSLGHPIRYYVSASSADFNKLDTKRADAANDEACNNIIYRSLNPDYRHWFLHGREAIEAKDGNEAITAIVAAIVGVEEEALSWNLPVPPNFTFGDKTPVDSWARATKISKSAKGEVRKDKEGQDIEVFDTKKETEDDYYNRVISMAVAAKKFASEDAARAHWQKLAESVALECPFEVEAAARTSRLPARLSAKDKMTAAVMIVRGTVDRFLANQFKQVREATFVPTNDTAKMYAGKATVGDKDIDFNVSDKDAEALGRLVQEYRKWKEARAALEALTELEA